MRNAFAAEMVRLAETDPRVVLLSGDIGNRLFNPFKELAPERFFNCGVAEANMIGVAAGMAMSGMRPIVYTIAPFLTARVFEQIRLDVCHHHAPVIIVGVGAGLSYAGLGPTHHTLEDMALMRTLPGMTVLAPGDAMEVRALLNAAMAQDGPVYMRMGKKNEPVVHETVPALEIGKGKVLRDGKGVCLLATGTLLPEALAAGDRLGARVVSLHTVKPLDTGLLEQAFRDFGLVVTVEEHGLAGGLGGAIAEWTADHGPLPARLLRIGVPDTFIEEAGSVAYHRQRLGLDADGIVAAIERKGFTE